MQSNKETPIPPQTNTNTSPTTHDPVLTPDDEAFFRQIMSRPDAAGSETGNAVTVDAPGPVAQDAEEFGKKLGEQQRKATDLEEQEQEKGDDKDKNKENKEQESGPAEGKKKRWSLNWPWGKGKKVRLYFGEILGCSSSRY